MTANAALQQLRGDVLYEVGVDDVEKLRWHPSTNLGKSPQAWTGPGAVRSPAGHLSGVRSIVESKVGKRPSTALGVRNSSVGPLASGRPASAASSMFGQQSTGSHARPRSAAAIHRAGTPGNLAASIRTTAQTIEKTVGAAGDRLFGRLVDRLGEMDSRNEQLFDTVSSRPSTRPGTALTRPGTAMSRLDQEATCVPDSSDVPAPWSLLFSRMKDDVAKFAVNEKAGEVKSANEDVLQNLEKARDKLERHSAKAEEEEECQSESSEEKKEQDPLPAGKRHSESGAKRHSMEQGAKVLYKNPAKAEDDDDHPDASQNPSACPSGVNTPEKNAPSARQSEVYCANSNVTAPLEFYQGMSGHGPLLKSGTGKLETIKDGSESSAVSGPMIKVRESTQSSGPVIAVRESTAGASSGIVGLHPGLLATANQMSVPQAGGDKKHRRLSACVVQPGKPSSLEQDASSSEVAAACRSRSGAVLRKQSILKCDHFPSGRNKKLPIQLDQAPNFRQVPDLPIYGVAQPTVDGCVEVLEEIRKTESELKRIFWINCREEPVVYINGRPYACRDRSNPYVNLETVGIEPEQLQEMEEQLRQEVIEDAKRYNGRILLHGERIPESDTAVAAIGEMYAYWEPLQETFCLSEVFAHLKKQFPELQFERLPITDEHAPEEKDFDDLVDMLAPALQENEYCGLIFNCQLGRGRTTTGMVLGVLLSHLPTFDKGVNFTGALPGDKASSRPSSGTTRPSSGGGLRPSAGGNPMLQLHPQLPATGLALPSDNNQVRRGSSVGQPGTRQHRAASIMPGQIDYGGFEFTVIMALLNRLPSGPTARRWVDGAIEACNHMVNLRTVLNDKKKRMEKASDVKKQAKEKKILIDFIERYVYLILFSQYLETEIQLIESGNNSFPSMLFREWMQALHEKISVYELLDDIEAAV